MIHTVYIHLRRRNGEPERMVISSHEHLTIIGDPRVVKWEILARCHSRKSDSRAQRLAELLVEESFAEYAHLYDNPIARQNKWCECERCSYTAICTPSDDFYSLPKSGEVVCSRCFAEEIGPVIEAENRRRRARPSERSLS